MNFMIGISIVFISMHQFFTFREKAPKARATRRISASAYSRGQDFVLSPSSDHLKVLSDSRSSSPEKSALPQ